MNFFDVDNARSRVACVIFKKRIIFDIRKMFKNHIVLIFLSSHFTKCD